MKDTADFYPKWRAQLPDGTWIHGEGSGPPLEQPIRELVLEPRPSSEHEVALAARVNLDAGQRARKYVQVTADTKGKRLYSRQIIALDNPGERVFLVYDGNTVTLSTTEDF